MKVEVRYSWRHKWAGRMITSRIKMTEQRAMACDPHSVRVDGSREEFVDFDQPAEILYYGCPPSFAGVGQSWKSVLIYPCPVPGREGKVPLRGSPGQYVVRHECDVWTVVQIGEPPVLMYQGDGPVFVEVAP